MSGFCYDYYRAVMFSRVQGDHITLDYHTGPWGNTNLIIDITTHTIKYHNVSLLPGLVIEGILVHLTELWKFITVPSITRMENTLVNSLENN